MRNASCLCALVIGLGVAASAARAQTPGPGNGAANLPVVQAPVAAPDWVKPGTRLVYKVWTRTPPQGQTKGSAGVSWAVLDVMDVPAAGQAGTGKGIVDYRLYFINTLQGGEMVGSPTVSSVALEPGVNEWWTNPTSLARAIELAKQQNTQVAQGPVQVGNVTYQAVNFRTKTDDAETSVSFDQATGAVVQLMQSVKINGKMESTYLSQLVERRQRPFVQAFAMPGWVGQTPRLQFAGTKTMTIPGGAPMQNELTLVFNFKAVIGGAVQYKVDHTEGALTVPGMNLPPTGQAQSVSIDYYTAATNIGGPWLSPAFLQSVTQGQTLDQDQAMGSTLRVTAVGQMPDGRAMVTFTEEFSGSTSISTYDRNAGTLLQGQSTDRVMYTDRLISYQGAN